MPATITAATSVSKFQGKLSVAVKRIVPALMAVALLFGLSACGSNTSTATETSSALASAQKLALGTLKLENTDQAIDAQSASELLPLWELLGDLSTSGTAAPQEITATIEAIQATMTSDQISAINKMQIGETEIASATQSLGASAATGSSSSTSGVQAAAAPADPSMGGDVAAGGMPPDAGGGMAPGGSAPGASSAQGTTSSSTTKTPSTRTRSTAALIKQVINLLESKLQS